MQAVEPSYIEDSSPFAPKTGFQSIIWLIAYTDIIDYKYNPSMGIRLWYHGIIIFAILTDLGKGLKKYYRVLLLFQWRICLMPSLRMMSQEDLMILKGNFNQ